ncbi:uncharacterized protein FRV6_08723 [Fusarium oxysporum]|uniref:Uncharacterized protein n=1 Tax=Fusarium oxysporum TaxID=5507 RepID=A0A2H3TMX0_FUSOX|nr:uncharacterized protein FRV6_08723 [Fusarium oxysporum]
MSQPWENSWGTPDNCNGDVPVCNGYDCPSQHNGGGSQPGGHGGNWDSTAQGVSNGGSQPSPNGGSSSGSSSGSNQGPNGPNGSGPKDTQPSIVPVVSGAVPSAGK